MRERTLVLAVGVVVLAALGRPLTERAESAALSAMPTSVVPMLVQPTPLQLRLVIGDTFAVRLRSSGVIGLASLAGGVSPAQTTFVSSDTTVATVSNGAVVAKDSGVATITATQVGAQGVAGAIVVEVMLPRQAVNEVALEVCPNEADRLSIRRSRPLTEEHEAIHEFHDCQRLIKGTAYSAVVGIFAHRNVQTFERWEDYRAGRLVATVVNFIGDKAPQAYAPLGLKPGTSCLVLRATSEADWQATLVPQRDTAMREGDRFYDSCEDRGRWDLPDAQWDALEVELQYGVDMKGDSIAPPVARWDWDEPNRENYMGVKCGRSRWCEIGRKGFSPSEPITMRRKFWKGKKDVIKGYYDQQYLADSTGEHPTTVFGTIRPGGDLRSSDSMAEEDDEWYDVAEIKLEETSREKTHEYRRYVRDYAGRPRWDWLLLKDKKTDLDLGRDPEARHPSRMYTGRLNGKRLADDAIIFRPHGKKGHHTIPTVRWRWHQDDERTWSFCDPEGCCETASLRPTDQDD